MSEATKTTKGKKVNWTKAQALGFWFLLTAVSMFWTGVYLGGVANENSHNAIEQAKVSAIEEATSKE